MITNTMQVRCCVSEAEQLIDQVWPLGLDFFYINLHKNTGDVTSQSAELSMLQKTNNKHKQFAL